MTGPIFVNACGDWWDPLAQSCRGICRTEGSSRVCFILRSCDELVRREGQRLIRCPPPENCEELEQRLTLAGDAMRDSSSDGEDIEVFFSDLVDRAAATDPGAARANALFDELARTCE